MSRVFSMHGTVMDRNTIRLDEPLPMDHGGVKVMVELEEGKPKGGLQKFGSAKGEIFMSDDFDAPLEDFKDYM